MQEDVTPPNNPYEPYETAPEEPTPPTSKIAGTYAASSIVCWGDSLSHFLCKPPNANAVGYEDMDVTGPSYMQNAVDAAMPGTTVFGRGVGSETSTEIALRQGAYQMKATFPNNTIPASGQVPVAVDAPQGDYLKMTVRVTIAGVPGILSRANQILHQWTYTRDVAGQPVTIEPQTPVVIPQSAAAGLPSIFWAGRNNAQNPETIKADVAAMVAHHGDAPYLVVGVTPGWKEIIGTEGYNKRQQLNSDLKATYGNRFVDLEAYLADRAMFDAGIWPTTADNDATASGTNPPSLTASWTDTVHFNATGNKMIAQHLSSVFGQPDNLALRSLDPKGDFATLVSDTGEITVVGWTFDPSDHYASTTIDVWMDGALVTQTVPASLPSTYLFAYGVPGQHAFVTKFRATSVGDHEICVVGRNLKHGADSEIRCLTTNVTGLPAPQVDPQGDAVVQDVGGGVLAVMGWAFDHSALTANIQVSITINGSHVTTVPAAGPSEYLYPYGVPGKHSFFTGAQARPGLNIVCIAAINTGPGIDKVIGCHTLSVYVPPPSPFGDLELGMDNAGNVTITGWAVDLSAPVSPVVLMVTVDGSPRLYTYANQYSPDLAAYGIPGNHRVSVAFGLTKPGASSVCIYAINIGPGDTQQLRCSDMSTGNYNPQGAVAIQRNTDGKLFASGWVIDWNAPLQPVTISVYDNGRFVTSTPANGVRAELEWLFGWPYNHGFAVFFEGQVGNNHVCVYAINIGRGDSQSIGCVDFNIPENG